MIKPYKGRGANPGDLVDVYRNIHENCWSIRAVSGPHKGQVIAHADTVGLESCTFRVSKAGRERVLREKKKNVHAFVRGRIMDPDTVLPTLDRVRYNPYESDKFHTMDAEPVSSAIKVVAGRTGRLYAFGWV